MEVRDARALIKKQKLVPMVRTGTLISLVDAIAGEPVRGSWWGHPAGKEIFRIASALDDDPTVLVAKILDGKITFVDQSLFAPIYRVVTDRRWRAAHAGDALLSRSYQVHTERGSHATVTQPWSKWASEETKEAARALELAGAIELIRTSSGGAKSPLLDFPQRVTKS